LKTIKESYEICGYNSTEALLGAIGNGSITVRNIVKKIRPLNENVLEEAKEESTENFIDFARSSAKGIKLQGIKNLMVNFGKCCSPIPGDDMIGFITRGRGITVHQTSCKSLPLLSGDSDRLIPVEWNVSRKDLFAVQIKIVCEDRKGRLKEITECIAGENINITSVDAKVKDGVGITLFVIKVNNLRQLDRVVRKLTKIDGIDYVERKGR
jgi:GTP pyrophosphokinase